MTPGFKALSSKRPVRQNKDTQGLSTEVRSQKPSPLTSGRARPTLTFWTAVCGAYHRSVLPDLQVGFSVLVVVRIEVPLPDLTPKLEEGAGVRDRICLVDPQQEDSQQQTDPQSLGPNSRFHPVHHCDACSDRESPWEASEEPSQTPGTQQRRFRFRLGLRQREYLFLLC